MNPSPNFYFMKPILNPMLFIFIVILSAVSCNKDELFVDTTADTVIVDTPTDSTTVGDGSVNDNNPIVTTTIPCDFSLDTVLANDTVIINCILDLGGQTFNLPTGVSIIYEGGDIINGTLNFSSGSVISGELLNSSLTLSGTLPQLKSPIFNFIPSRWGIVEGEVGQNVALKNSSIVHNLILLTKSLQADTFSIDKLDAYFYQEEFFNYIFQLPSDFNLKMTDNTNLRVFPNNDPLGGNLVMILNSENVTVTGGNLHGDRDTHDYTSGGTHEQGHLLKIKTGINIKIENVHMRDAIGDGLDVESYRLRNDPLFERGSSNVLITGCVFDSNRRNNLSITDGEDIIVENCTFLNAGITTAKSTGTAPRSAIDIEPDIQDYNNPWQLVDRLTIRNNIEKGPQSGLIVFTGFNVLVTGNTFENSLSASRAFNVKIINNTARSISAGILEISDPRNYEVSGNTVSNPTGSGIFAANPGVQIFDNKIINCKTGMQLQNLNDANIYNNTITGSEDGINAFGGGKNLLIKGNTINVQRPFFFSGVNAKTGQENDSFTFTNNIINSSGTGSFQGSNGINLVNNDFTNGVRFEGSTNAIVQNNNFKLTSGTAINIRGEQSNNIQIIDNLLESINPSSYSIYGEGDISWGNRNIIINNNVFNNSGINSRYYDGWTVKNNKGYLGNNNGGYITFRGNNSLFESNRGLNGEILNHDIQGSNNTIID